MKTTTPKGIATRVDEFCPDSCITDNYGRKWLQVSYTEDQCPRTDFPNIVNYDGERYYWMSFNSDHMYVTYAAAQGRAFHNKYGY